MTDKERRDERFQKLCKWMSEAREISEILREECAVVKTCLTADEDDTKGIRSAVFEIGESRCIVHKGNCNNPVHAGKTGKEDAEK